MILNSLMGTSFSNISDDYIELRSLVEDDVSQEYVNWLNDPLVNKFLECRHQKHSVESVKQYVSRLSADASDEVLCGIFIKDSGVHIGNIKLGPINAFHKHAPIGLLIGDLNYWGKGIGTRAIKLISLAAVEYLGLKALYAGCYSDNVGSFRAFLKAGWQSSGCFPSYWLTDDQSRNDELLLTYVPPSTMDLPSHGGITLIGAGPLMTKIAIYLRENGIQVLTVFAPRHSDESVLHELEDNDINTFVCNTHPDRCISLQEKIKTFSRLCLCFGPAWIFSDEFIGLYESRIFNYNGIPLPCYVGGAHFTWQILNQSLSGGCYLQQITKSIDRGPVYRGLQYFLESDDSYEPIIYENRNLVEGFNFLVDFFEESLHLNKIVSTAIDINWGDVLYFPRLFTPQHAWIDWSWTGDEIMRFSRAFGSPYSGARTSLNGDDVCLRIIKFIPDGSIHPFCSGLIVNIDKESSLIKVLVKGGFLLVDTIESLDSSQKIIPRLGSRFITSIQMLEDSKKTVAYDQDGLVRDN